MPCLLATTGRKLSHPAEHLFDLLGLTCELKFRRIEASDWEWKELTATVLLQYVDEPFV